MKKILLTIATVLCTNLASAAIISADFKNQGNLPYLFPASSPITFQASNVTVGAGVEFDDAIPVSNPSGWQGGQVAVDIDPLTNILTLTARNKLDFQTYLVAITNIGFNSGESLAGISLLSNQLVSPLYTPTFSVSGNSIQISYDSGAGNAEFFFKQGNTATFQLATTANVPVPASLALLASGLLLMGRKFIGTKR
jgi:hypothetical protein